MNFSDEAIKIIGNDNPNDYAEMDIVYALNHFGMSEDSTLEDLQQITYADIMKSGYILFKK